MFSQLKKKRQNSSASIAANKGLLNEPGENNCFLNSAIQVLWHLDVFRRSFRLLDGHACMGASCIFCALKDIFQQFQYSKDHALPPNVLRSALAESFQQENRFQLGLMDDAAECFENILNRIHLHIGSTKHEDVCTAPHCIPHQKFGLTLIQHSVCQCGATSEPFPFIEMVHYVSATALCVENEAMCQRYGITSTSQMFGRLIRVAGSWGDMRSCPSECGQKVEMRNVLMNCPDVVSIGIVWDSIEPDVQHIIDLVNALGTTLRLTDLFHTVVDDRAQQMELYLVGMVCYYGKHYSTFFFHTKLRKWVYFDDAQVSEIGKRWSMVISKCIKGHHQPLLLLYANPDAVPVSVTTAPADITLLPGYSRQSPKKDSLINILEIDSAGSEDDYISFENEESSDTESIQVPPPLPAKTKKSSLEQKPQTNHDLLSGPIEPFNKYSSNIGKNKGSYQVDAKVKTSKTKETNPVSSYKLADVLMENTKKPADARPKKSAFQWNLTDENSHRPRAHGHYIEPQPANWTQYKPYKAHSPKSSSNVKSLPVQKTVKQSPDRSIAPSAKRTEKQEPGLLVHDVQAQQMKQISIGKRSPNHSRKSSRSSHSSASSSGRISTKSASTTTTKSSTAENFSSMPLPPYPDEVVRPLPSQSVSHLAQINNENFENEERCLKLFQEAEDLMEESRCADALLDYGSALKLCKEATQIIETVLMIDNLPDDYKVRAKIKHSECINKSKILLRRHNIRSKSKRNDPDSNRSSETDPTRQPTRLTNQVLGRSNYVDPSTNEYVPTSRANQVPSPAESRKKVLIGNSQNSSKGENRLLDEFETDDSKDNLIDFNRHGMSKIQHVVHNIFKRQGDSKHEKHHQNPPVVLLSKKTNVNNNSNNTGPSSKTVLDQKDPNSLEESPANIFVFSKPKNLLNSNPPTQPRNVISSTSSNQKIFKPEVATGLQANLNYVSAELANKLSLELRENTNLKQKISESTSPSESSRYRSVTPPPHTIKNSSLSQQRRAKTPTPSLNKDLLRTKQSISQRRNSDLKLNAQPNPIQREDSGSLKTSPASGYNSFPYHFPPWASLASGPGHTPATMPPEYFEHFYKLLQYYSTLPPEQQRSLFPFVPNGNSTSPSVMNFPLSANKAPPLTPHNMYETKAQSGKSYSNLMGRVLPNQKVSNTDIYQSSKPKPVSKTSSSSNVQTAAQKQPPEPTSSVRSNIRLNRGNPVDQRPSDLPTNKVIQTSRDGTNPIRSDKSGIKTNSYPYEPNEPNELTSKPREGMMKWAEEGKRRQPKTSLETRNRLLKEFTSARNKDVPRTSDYFSSDQFSHHKCNLCGIINVSSSGDYCENCQLYLERLKPSTRSTRIGKNLLKIPKL